MRYVPWPSARWSRADSRNGVFSLLQGRPVLVYLLVTAAHIIEHTDSPDYSDDGFIYLYLNAKVGTRFQIIPTKTTDWVFHPTNSAIDVAVLPWSMDPAADHSALNFEQPPGLEPNPKTWRVEVGTDVFITGLFLRHPGRQRNIPVVRTGA